MLGHEGVTAALYKSITHWLPQVGEQMRAELGLDASGFRIPEPQNMHPAPVDAVQIGQFPALMVDEMETGPRASTRSAASMGDLDTYLIRYKFRVWLWASDPRGPRETAVAIKRLATAVRISLLVNKLIFDDKGESAVIDPKTFQESFSDVGQDKTNRYLAGSYIQFEVMSTETLRAIGTEAGLTARIGLHVGLMHELDT